jgi:lycopene beta-cyclase
VHDVAVLGSGPAGWATAAACSQAGLDCVLISPTPDLVWPNTYGGWADDFEPGIPVAFRWDRVVVHGDRRHEVGRAYVVLDNEALLARFRSQFKGSVVAASVAGVRHVDADTSLHGSSYGEVAVVGVRRRAALTARLIVDATGANSTLLSRVAEPTAQAPVVQSAFGVVGEITGMPEPGVATTMDWRGPDRDAPSFLYALDYGNGQWLVEETSLAHRPGLSDDELERRLYARLKNLGAHIVSVQRTERVRFAMDVALPVIPQPIVGIGAAAAVVHPATGYSVAASLRSAPLIAAEYAKWLDAPAGYRNSSLAAEVWNAVWPSERLAARRLEQYGMERTLLMDQKVIRAFFDAFFSLPVKDIAVYMSGTSTQAELAAVMWKVFNAAPMRVRTKLASGNPLRLAKALLG